jgi:hypothetical protein
VFPGPAAKLPGKFHTGLAGHLDLSGSTRVLVSLSNAQKIWEINLQTGEVLWEFVCVDSAEHHPRNLLTAKYVREAHFSFNKDKGSEEMQ